jgi:hypothetical protein
MLYASTRSSLISTLGLRTQRLHSQILATSKSDLQFPTADTDAVRDSMAELSVQEKELARVKAAEAEGAHGTSKRTNLVSSSGIQFPLTEAAKEALLGLKDEGDGNLVQLVWPLFWWRLMRCLVY